MKYLLTIVLTFVCLNAKSQVTSIGKTESQITEYLASLNTHETLIKREVLSNGVLTLQYNNDNLTPRAYFLVRDTCVKYVLGGLLPELPSFISALNVNYKKISTDQWVDNSYVYKVTLTTDDKSYYATFEKM